MARHDSATAAAMAKTARISSLTALQEWASPHMARRPEELSSKGPSSWLTALPLNEHGFHLSKQDF